MNLVVATGSQGWFHSTAQVGKNQYKIEILTKGCLFDFVTYFRDACVYMKKITNKGNIQIYNVICSNNKIPMLKYSSQRPNYPWVEI